ncbi:cob(I)yrinic acid a,c-diamide adenosyltransferase [Pusillimonas sp. MFBS29]|uniref:cob(I)yrinic acid a,c-diamide adenosyltransferase n=1 Tax=Pusillimonas sp. MFBS29 TaxID=2886690 RepID=UPI001D10EE1E|nr:cob(I)yrinic acid a,c-diamide adenosyltransferase [Pusillimonas sp. MFBS29]MCC2595817.1 cob(I)yrinic acid a,c-diamide adenosyltransferase [Pusillimonas sp. MFBS29]
MATRLSVIATRTGDAGTTGLGDGSRVPKNAPRIEAMGNVDELNSVIGLLRTEALPTGIDKLLARVQNDLFDLGAELCIPGHAAITEAHVTFLDTSLDHYNADLGKLQEFILPGGSRSAALAHLARTVCRRTERSVVALHADETINAPVMQYLNRLSDLCFVLSRALNRAAGQSDILWSREPVV